jgi:SAM-dependent methyltransferase
MTAPTADQLDPAEPFDRFASFYDRFTAHHRYDEWMTSLEALALSHGLSGRRLLDVACGTGKSLEPMLERGYEAVGCDLSAPMLARAREKLAGRARLLEADMRELPELDDEDDLLAAFRSAARCLAPGGVYLFDLNTLHTYRDLFSRDMCHEHDGWSFSWRGLSSPHLEPGDSAEALVEAWEPLGDDLFRRHRTTHVQRHFPPERVTELLREAGLQPLGVYGQFPDSRPIDPHLDEARHTKALFISGPEL